MTIEVRCCCQPQKLLGFVTLPYEVHAGQIVRLAVRPERRQDARWSPFDEPSEAITVGAVHLSLPVAYWSERDLEPRLALKAEETPLEVLARVQGFTPAVSDDGASR